MRIITVPRSPLSDKTHAMTLLTAKCFFFSLSLSLSLLRESAQLKPDAEQNFIIRRINPSVGSSSFHASLPRPRELLKAHTCPIGLLILQNLFMYHPIRLQPKTFFSSWGGSRAPALWRKHVVSVCRCQVESVSISFPCIEKRGEWVKKREKK